MALPATNLDQFFDLLAQRIAEDVAERLRPALAPRRIKESPDVSEWLTTREAAQYLKCSYQRLEGLRTHGGGPLFAKEGRSVRYRRSDLDAYRAARMRKNTVGDR